jgi:hypothetical protein
MKTRSFFALLVVCLLSTTVVQVQAQQFGINYQAVARALGGVVVSNQPVNLRFTITAGESGAVLYQETQTATTNFYGQFSCQIGKGTVEQGTFSSIPWVNQNQYLKVELMAAQLTKNDYVVLGNNPFTAVPFSFYALNSPQGPQGPVGPAGPAGPQGSAGPQGPAGPTGATGSQGNTGTTITVTAAYINPSGDLVLNFSDGSSTTTAASIVGPQGPTGLTGPTGATGGTIRVTGTTINGSGDLVLTFADGSSTTTPTSIIGPVGPQGPAGATGTAGTQGLTGPQGLGISNVTLNADYTIDFTYTDGTTSPHLGPIRGAAGSSVTGASIDPYTGHLILTFSDGSTDSTSTSIVGAAGAAGPQGPSGSQGPAGPAGSQGPAGPTGSQGPAGNDGATGPAGPAGPAGSQGPTGNDGATGSQGPAGPTGSQGPAGNDGATGPAGPTGPAGASPQVSGSSVNAQGDLTLTFFDGTNTSSTTTTSLFDPNEVDSVYIGTDSTLNIIHLNGNTFKSQKIIGAAGKGIDSLYLKADTSLISHYLDGHTDTVSLSGVTDTLWKDSAGSIISNPYIPFVGIGVGTPLAPLDVNGAINFYDTASLQIGYHPILRVNHIQGTSSTYYSCLFVGDSAAFTNYTSQNLIHDVFVGSNAGHDNGQLENTFIGASSGQHNSTGLDNTFVGYSSGISDPSGAFNSVFGADAGQNTSAEGGNASQNNSFFGYKTGFAFQGSLNTLLGTLAGGSSSGASGDSNTVVGENAGFSMAGYSNTIVGQSAGKTVASNENTILGANAGSVLSQNGDQNTLVGYNSGIKTTAGFQNVFIGANAAPSNQGGSQNVAIGASVAPSLSKSTLNVALGPNADINESVHQGTIVSGIAIGSSAQVGNTNSITIGTNSLTQGVNTIGIGRQLVSYGDDQIVIGEKANGGNEPGAADSCIIIGDSAIADGSVDISIGNNSNVQSDYGIDLGTYTVNSGTQSVVIGYNASVNDNYSVTLGSGATTAGSNPAPFSTALGYKANTGVQGEADSSLAAGSYANVNGIGGTAIGANGQAWQWGTAVGSNSFVNNNYGTALGYLAVTEGNSAVAIGSNVNFPDNVNDIFGADYSVAIGSHSLTDGIGAIALGSGAMANGVNSAAFGRFTKALNDNSMVFGDSHMKTWGFGMEVPSASTNIIEVKLPGTGTTTGPPPVTATVAYMDVNGNWSVTSDVNLKENFETINIDTLLDKLSTLPITQWNYKNDPMAKHIGPMAQDFFSQFHLGTDNTKLSPIDPAGVALAAIKGLYNKVKEDESKIQELQSTVAKQQQQQAQIDALTQRLDNLEKKLANGNNH